MITKELRVRKKFIVNFLMLFLAPVILGLTVLFYAVTFDNFTGAELPIGWQVAESQAQSPSCMLEELTVNLGDEADQRKGFPFLYQRNTINPEAYGDCWGVAHDTNKFAMVIDLTLLVGIPAFFALKYSYKVLKKTIGYD